MVEHLRIPKGAVASIEAEAHRLAAFWHPAIADREVALRQIAG